MKKDINSNKISLPEEMFEGFLQIVKDNEEEFRFLVGQLIIQYLEDMAVKNKALEFPPCISAEGRSIIHSLADFLGIFAFSSGKAKTRKISVFPKNMFKEVQERETEKTDKEKDKLRIKYKDYKFQGVPDENATNTRDKMIREIYFE